MSRKTAGYLLCGGLLAVLLSGGPLWAEDEECVGGFSAQWVFDTTTDVVTLEGETIRPQVVCYTPHWPISRANMRFVLWQDEEVVLTKDLHWYPVTHYDYIDEHGKQRGGAVIHEKDSRTIAFPVALHTVTQYEVIDLYTHIILGQGKIARPAHERAAARSPASGPVPLHLGQPQAAGAGLRLATAGWGKWPWWRQAPAAGVQERLDRGADPMARDADGLTPLHLAALLNPNPAVAALLLDRGADLTAQADDGETPLHLAAGDNANPAVVGVLLDRGADLTAQAEDDLTPLHWAAGYNANPAVAAVLLNRGADLTAQTWDGETPLHLAARFNENPAVVTRLLDQGADLTARDRAGWTPLYGATAHNANPAVAAVLLDRGADLTAPDRLGDTPLHAAARFNANPAMAALLLDRGAAVDARTPDGLTPLHMAAWSNANPAVVAVLLDRGADATLRDNQHRLPIDRAKENEHLQGTDVYRRLNETQF